MKLEALGRSYMVSLDEEMTWTLVDHAIIAGRNDVALRLLVVTMFPSQTEAEEMLAKIISNWKTQLQKASEENEPTTEPTL